MRSEYQISLGTALAVAIWIFIVILMNIRQHPKVLFYLFMVELWERFSYYGNRALLILYLTKTAVEGGFGVSKDAGYGIYGAYGALVYLTPLLGGFLADKFLGFRRAIIWGAILMAAGQFTLFASYQAQPVAPQKIMDLAKALSSEDGGVKQAAQTQAAEYAKDVQMRSFVKQLAEQIKKKATTDERAQLDTLMTALGGPVDPAKGDIVEPVTDTQNNKLLMYLGLSLLILGNGFFKPNISSLIGKFYQQGDPRRDGAFTIFYMGINIGAFIAPLTCGTVGEVEGWGYCFLLAGAGMVLGLIIFLITTAKGLTEDKAEAAKDAPTTVAGLPISLIIYIGSFLILPVLGGLIWQNDIMDALLAVVGLAAVGYILFLSFQYEKVERQRLWVITILLLFTTIFWTFFELAGSALNVFTDNNVSKSIFGLFDLKTSNFQAVNALFIMVFAPIFSFMWVYLSKINREPAAPIKFAIALLLLGAGFLVLNLGIPMAQEAMIPAMFLILLYLLHTLGELALSPVGLSLVTKMAPAKIVAFMMGFWFLSSSIAHQAGKQISKYTTVDEKATKEESLELAMTVFNQVGFVALASGVLLLLLSPIIKKWMHGIK